MVPEYFYHRAVFLTAHRATPDVLFFKLGGDFDHLSSNSIRGIEDRVAKAMDTTSSPGLQKDVMAALQRQSHREGNILRFMSHESARPLISTTAGSAKGRR